jgi:DNA-binding beta-propeller fold protein YncE
VSQTNGDAGADSASMGGTSATAGSSAAGVGGMGAAGASGATGAGAAGAGGATAVGGATGTGAAGSGAGGSNMTGPFVLKTPIDGDPTVTTQPTLTWAASLGANGYIVEIAPTPTFGAGDVVQKVVMSTTSYTVTDTLQPGVVYYWTVSALTGDAGPAPTVATNAPFRFTSPVTAGPSPHGVAVTSDGKLAVVGNDKPSGSVTLVDLSTFKTQAIALTGQPGMVAVTPDATRALVVEGSPNDVVVIDLASATPVARITPPCVATTLYGIAVKPDGSAAVMPDFNGGCTKDVLDVVALPGTTISPAYDLMSSASAFGVAVTPDSKTALITRGVLSTSVKLVDLATGGLTTIMNTSSSFGAAVTPDGKEALVSSGEGDTIKRVSLTTNAVTGSIMFATNQDVGNLAVVPSGKLAVAVGDFTTGVINLADGTVASHFSIAGRSVAVTPDGHRALVTGAGAGGKLYVLPLQ